MVSFIFQEPGYHTIEIKENYSRSKDYSINGLVYSYDVDTNAKISFNVLDAAASEDKFYKRMLREHKGENDRKTLENLEEYFQKNLKYPMMARESDIQGRVFVGFVVEKDGSISNVKVLRGIGGGCDEEAVRVVQSLPKFKPGKQRGNPVRVQYTLPIVFKLQ